LKKEGSKSPPYSGTTLWDALAVMIDNPCTRQGAIKIVDSAIRHGMNDTDRLVAMKDDVIFDKLKSVGSTTIHPSDVIAFRREMGAR
jgi:hypothetical protein